MDQIDWPPGTADHLTVPACPLCPDCRGLIPTGEQHTCPQAPASASGADQ